MNRLTTDNQPPSSNDFTRPCLHNQPIYLSILQRPGPGCQWRSSHGLHDKCHPHIPSSTYNLLQARKLRRGCAAASRPKQFRSV